jgi:flagellar L-ring protein precursor FlgH
MANQRTDKNGKMKIETAYALARLTSNRELNVPVPEAIDDVIDEDMHEHSGHACVGRFAAVTAAVLLLLAGACVLPGQEGERPVETGGGTAASKIKGLQTLPHLASMSLNTYLDRVHATTTIDQPTPGSIWTDSGRFTRLTTDVRASRPNDLISVVVTESLAAETDGTVANTRSSSASSQISALMGLLHAGNAMQNLLNQNSAAALAAKGQSATNSSLSTTFGGQVVAVLPNGVLVIEAAREVEFSQQTQTIVLRGLVRPEDISQQNQVLSTAISSLELEVRGKGIVNDFTRRQNPLVRFIEKILVF